MADAADLGIGLDHCARRMGTDWPKAMVQGFTDSADWDDTPVMVGEMVSTIMATATWVSRSQWP